MNDAFLASNGITQEQWDIYVAQQDAIDERKKRTASQIYFDNERGQEMLQDAWQVQQDRDPNDEHRTY